MSSLRFTRKSYVFDSVSGEVTVFGVLLTLLAAPAEHTHQLVVH
jgi:hypothetical protein